MIENVIIGVQKSATSWLYESLKISSNISVRNDKREMGMFQENMQYLEWYNENFTGEGPFTEVSVDYIKNIGALEILIENNPNIKVNVILRAPKDRFYSSVNWLFRKGKLNVTSETISTIHLEMSEIKDLLSRSLYGEDLQKLSDLNVEVNVWNYEWIRDDMNGFLKNFSKVNYGDRRIATNAPKRKVSSNKVLDKMESFFHRNDIHLIGKIISKISDAIPNRYAKVTQNKELDAKLSDIFRRDQTLLTDMFVDSKVYFYGFDQEVFKRWYTRECL